MYYDKEFKEKIAKVFESEELSDYIETNDVANIEHFFKNTITNMSPYQVNRMIKKGQIIALLADSKKLIDMEDLMNEWYHIKDKHEKEVAKIRYDG